MRKRIILIFLVLFFIRFLSLADQSSPYGINAHLGSNSVLSKIKDAGIEWIRIDFYWSQIEKSKGTFDYKEIDRIVKYCRNNKIFIVGILSSAPLWSNNGKGINYPPTDINDWKNFVASSVKRYENDIKYWNIWNEPNVKKFFALEKDIFVRDIFLPAAATIRTKSPLSFIVGPELAHLEGEGSEWYFWMKYILTECKDYIDIVSHHIYKNSGVYSIFEALDIGENILPSVKKVIEDSGFASSPFWITETGWDTELFSEEEQGNRYLEFLKEMRLRDCPDKIFFYQIIDDATPGIRPWGIIRSDFTEKPAYGIYRDFISGMYPEDPEANTEEPSKKCYMENSIANSSLPDKGKMLSNLRLLRDIGRMFPVANKYIDAYYRIEKELSVLALNNPVFLKKTLKIVTIIDTVFFKRLTNPKVIVSKLIPEFKSIFSLLKKRKISPELMNMIVSIEKTFEYLSIVKLPEHPIGSNPSKTKIFSTVPIKTISG